MRSLVTSTERAPESSQFEGNRLVRIGLVVGVAADLEVTTFEAREHRSELREDANAFLLELGAAAREQDCLGQLDDHLITRTMRTLSLPESIIDFSCLSMELYSSRRLAA